MEKKVLSLIYAQESRINKNWKEKTEQEKKKNDKKIKEER